MKTRLLHLMIATALIMMCSPDALSQGLGLGAKFGINLATMSNFSKFKSDVDPSEDLHHTPLIGMQGSFILNPMFSKYIGLEVDLGFEQKGEVLAMEEVNISGDEVKYRMVYRLNYFTLPVLFKAGYAGDVFRIYGIVGPYLGVAISGKAKDYEDKELQDTYTVEFGKGEASDDNSKIGGFKGYKANRLDAGIVVGVQPAIHLGPGELFMDIRYNIGFIDIDHPTSDEKSQYNDQANLYGMNAYYPRCQRAIGISVGYIIRLGEK